MSVFYLSIVFAALASAGVVFFRSRHEQRRLNRIARLRGVLEVR